MDHLLPDVTQGRIYHASEFLAQWGDWALLCCTNTWKAFRGLGPSGIRFGNELRELQWAVYTHRGSRDYRVAVS
eukprot:5549726-Amphidinium_carterae.2